MNDIDLYRQFLSASEAIRSEFQYDSKRAFFLGNEQLSAIKYPTDKFIQYSALPGFEDQKIVFGGIQIGDPAPGVLLVTEPVFEDGVQYDVRLKALGIRLLQLLGIEELIIFGKGEQINKETDEEQLFWAEDHINLSGSNPLVGHNLDELGERFPDMSGVYDSELTSNGIKATENFGLSIIKGVWASAWNGKFLPENFRNSLHENKINVISNQGMHEVITATHGKIKTALTLLINSGENEAELLNKMLTSLCSGSN